MNTVMPGDDLVLCTKKHYFVNETVEWELAQYIWTGCTCMSLRDQIMSHATELIRQIIRKQGLHTIYPGQEESAFGDLLQTGWVQIERTLYKYRARPHCRSCFNQDRPSDSLLYEPGQREYGIKTLQEVVKISDNCPRCGHELVAAPIVEPMQGRYGGSSTILYRGMSKVFNMWCVAPDTQLLTSVGLAPIIDVVNDRIDEVYGSKGMVNVSAAIAKPTVPTLIVRTQLGYYIECSHEHKLCRLDVDPDGACGPTWCESNQLSVGDLLGIEYCTRSYIGNDDISSVVLQSRGKWNPPKTITPELAYIIGLYIAEGSWSYGKLVIYNLDAEIIDALVHNTLGLNFIHEKKYGRVSLCNKRFIELLEQLGFKHINHCSEKYISARLLQCSREIIVSMLRGMFDGDGHASQYNGTVGYTSCSRVLVDQLRMLLLNDGMLTKISHDTRAESVFGNHVRQHNPNGSWQVLLSTEDSRTFYDQIGFNVARKHGKQQYLRPAHPIIYGLGTAFNNLYKKYGPGKLGYNAIRTMIIPRAYTYVSTAVDKLRSWADHANDNDYIFIAQRLDEATRDHNRIVWLPINSIEDSHNTVCEISVDSDDHAYVANGFVTHNSQISRTVILAYIKKEARDRKNSSSYIGHLTNKPRPTSDMMLRFLSEAKDMCKFHEDYLAILHALEYLIYYDDRPYDGIISKLVQRSGLSRPTVTGFIKFLKLRSLEFSDSPVSKTVDPKLDARRQSNTDSEEE